MVFTTMLGHFSQSNQEMLELIFLEEIQEKDW